MNCKWKRCVISQNPLGGRKFNLPAGVGLTGKDTNMRTVMPSIMSTFNWQDQLTWSFPTGVPIQWFTWSWGLEQKNSSKPGCARVPSPVCAVMGKGLGSTVAVPWYPSGTMRLGERRTCLSHWEAASDRLALSPGARPLHLPYFPLHLHPNPDLVLTSGHLSCLPFCFPLTAWQLRLC